LHKTFYWLINVLIFAMNIAFIVIGRKWAIKPACAGGTSKVKSVPRSKPDFSAIKKRVF